MQELQIAYRSIAWGAALGGYLLLRYEQWLPAAGYVVGAVFAALALWALQQMASALSAKTSQAWRWWWKGALWRYPLMLAALWLVSRQPVPFIMGFAAGVSLLPLGVGVLAFSRRWRRPTWVSVRYWAPKTVDRSQQREGIRSEVGRASR